MQHLDLTHSSKDDFMPNTFGHTFRITTFGESHGGAVGVVVDGCPAGIPIDPSKVQDWLDRRRPGQSKLASPRKEKDQVEFLSGTEGGLSLGTPICMIVRNSDAKKAHYDDIKKAYRPSHADFTTHKKFGIMAQSGGGRASARETIGRVAGAAIAEQILVRALPGFNCVGYVESVKGVTADFTDDEIEKMTRDQIEKHILRCPEHKNRDAMEKIILDAQKEGDTVGGTIKCYIQGVPIGLGDPVFDKLEADLAKAIMSLPACKGFEVGMGFDCTTLFGSEHNDPFIKKGNRIGTKTNRSGGIQGGISNGEPIYFRSAFKPVSTIFKEQDTVSTDGEEVKLKPHFGRHDPCVLPRAVPMVESMALLVLCDHLLRQKTYEAFQ
jgi:chorismate synthase